MSQQTIKLAARLYDNRDEVKAYLGPQFAAHMRAGEAFLTVGARALGKDNVLDVATLYAKEMTSRGDEYEARLLLAAAVEMLEPSK